LLICVAQAVSVAAAGTWTLTGSMTRSRAAHTATLLPSGKVLAAGAYLTSSELYDPVAGTWSATGNMTVYRILHTATLLLSGKVLVAGGFSTTGYIASAELYDPVLGTWTATGSMNTARGIHTATLLPSGKVLVTGGYNGSILASAELYDPVLGTWGITASMPSPARYYHTATLLPSGKVLVAGGAIGSNAAFSPVVYDPVSGTWSTTGNMNTHRYAHTATLLPSGKVLVAAGYNNLIGALASAELYDSVAGSWSTTGSMTIARYYHTATLLSSAKVLVAGGHDSSTLASAAVYDPVAGTWSTAGSMTTAREFHTATLLPSGKVLAAGGYPFPITSAELYEETPTPATLTLEPSMATNTAGAPHCVVATVEDGLSNPVPGLTVRFSVPTSTATQASPASGSATTDVNGQAQFCFSTPLPGMDDIHAYADADTDNTQDAGEPFDDATKTWVLPANTEFCEVMIKDVGRIMANNGDPAKFTGHAKVKADGTVQGEQHYEDLGPAQPLTVDSIELTATTCSEDRTTASIFGRATINGSGSHTFRVDVTEGPDTYGITLDTGYSSGQHPLTKGKVTIQ
jgi:WD40 repeat protein